MTEGQRPGMMPTRPLWTALLFITAACVSGSAEGHPSAGRSLKSTDNSYSSTPDSEVLLQDSNVVGKTLVRAVIDRSVLLKPVKPRPLPSPAKAPNPMQDLEIPTGTPGFVLGKASTGKPAPFSVDMVFQNSSRANQSEPQPSGANDLAYGRLGFPYTTQSALGQANQNSNPTSPSPTNEYPWAAAGQLSMTFPDGNFVCTASLIGPGLVVTAAHCIINFGTDTAATSVQFVPGRFDAYAPFGIWNVKSYFYPTVYRDGTDQCSSNSPGVVCANDIAVLVLAPDSNGAYAGDRVGYFGFAWNGYSFSSSFKADTLTAEITQLGYPCSLDSCTRMIRTDAPAITQDYNQQVMGSAQTGGSSGGPWVVNFGGYYSSQLSDPGIDYTPNLVTGVTSYGKVDESLKVQGSSRFGTNNAFPNEPNIVALVNAACSSLSSNERTLVCGTASSVSLTSPSAPTPPPTAITEDCGGASEGTLCDCLAPGNNCAIDSETLLCYESNGGSIFGPVGICLSGVCNYCDPRDPTPPFACPSGYKCRGQTAIIGNCTDQSYVYGTCVPV